MIKDFLLFRPGKTYLWLMIKKAGKIIITMILTDIASISAPEGKLLYEHKFTRSEERIISHETSVLMCAMLQKAVREGTGATMSGVYGVTFP